jgi:hypothetical protein
MYHFATISAYDLRTCEPGKWSREEYVLACFFNHAVRYDVWTYNDFDSDESLAFIQVLIPSGSLNTSQVDMFVHRMINKVGDLVSYKVILAVTPDLRHDDQFQFAMLVIAIVRATYGDDLLEAVLKYLAKYFTEELFVRVVRFFCGTVFKRKTGELKMFVKPDADGNFDIEQHVCFLKLYLTVVVTHTGYKYPQFIRPYDDLVRTIGHCPDIGFYCVQLAGKVFNCYGTNKPFYDKASNLFWAVYPHLQADYLADAYTRKVLERLQFKASVDLVVERPETFLRPFSYYQQHYAPTLSMMMEWRKALKNYQAHYPVFRFGVQMVR